MYPSYVKTKKRPYHHGDLRDALLQAAVRALENGGIQTLSLRELGRELGVSHTAFRRHFSDKQALLNALAIEGFEKLRAVVARAVADREQNFDTRLIKATRAYVRFATKHPALVGLMFTAKRQPDAAPDLVEAGERAFGIAPQVFAEGQAVGAVVEGDPERLAMTALAAMEGLVANSINGEVRGVPLERLVGEVMERIILGLRPRL
jgi:AcrR family transcriptional regulator